MGAVLDATYRFPAAAIGFEKIDRSARSAGTGLAGAAVATSRFGSTSGTGGGGSVAVRKGSASWIKVVRRGGRCEKN
jgi:hypothetical protein